MSSEQRYTEGSSIVYCGQINRFKLSCETWTLLNRFHTGQGPCCASLHKWGLVTSMKKLAWSWKFPARKNYTQANILSLFTNWKLACDFLLVTNNNLGAISHHFEDAVISMSNCNYNLMHLLMITLLNFLINLNWPKVESWGYITVQSSWS